MPTTFRPYEPDHWADKMKKLFLTIFLALFALAAFAGPPDDGPPEDYGDPPDELAFEFNEKIPLKGGGNLTFVATTINSFTGQRVRLLKGKKLLFEERRLSSERIYKKRMALPYLFLFFRKGVHSETVVVFNLNTSKVVFRKNSPWPFGWDNSTSGKAILTWPELERSDNSFADTQTKTFTVEK